MTTTVTPADIANLTQEQLAALANAIQSEQQTQQQLDTLLQTDGLTAPAASTTAPVVPTPAVAPAQNEAPINPIASAVLNGVNVATAAASAAEPVVAVIDPPAGVAIATAVAIVNALEGIVGYLGLVPDGTAKVGIQQQVAAIRGLINNP